MVFIHSFLLVHIFVIFKLKHPYMSLALPIRRSAGRSLLAQSRLSISSTQLDRRRFISSGKARSSAAAAVAHENDEYHVDAEKPQELRKSLSPEQKKFLESAVSLDPHHMIQHEY